MMSIWNAREMETVLVRGNREAIVEFAETILDEKLVRFGTAGQSKFSKAIEILADHDFEVYKILGNKLVTA